MSVCVYTGQPTLAETPVKNQKILLEWSFTTHMLLPMQLAHFDYTEDAEYSSTVPPTSSVYLRLGGNAKSATTTSRAPSESSAINKEQQQWPHSTYQWLLSPVSSVCFSDVSGFVLYNQQYKHFNSFQNFSLKLKISLNLINARQKSNIESQF